MIRSSFLLLMPLLFALYGSSAALALEASLTPTAQASAVLTPQPPSELGTLIAAGSLPDLHWPNFADHQADVAKFYAVGGYALAWVHDGKPTAQAKAMIQLFKQASLKGLNPDDYDASRWDGRLAELAPSNPHPADTILAQFDLALSVCAMRYISDLRIGRLNPQYFKFGLDMGPYDLAELLRNQVIQAQDVGAVIASVEPRYEGYQRAEAALGAYSKLAAEGDGAPLPLPLKSLRPGDTYSGITPLVSRLRQLGDLAPDAGALADTSIYQGAVVDAVKNFERRHGLQPDGVLGKNTVAQLSVPLSQRVKQLQFTLERYRWIQPNFPQPPIVVQSPRVRAGHDAPAARAVSVDAGGRRQGLWPPDARVHGLHALRHIPAVLERPDVDRVRRADSQNPARPRLSGRARLRSDDQQRHGLTEYATALATLNDPDSGAIKIIMEP